MSEPTMISSDLPRGAMVGEYSIEEKIGEGGMGQVYRAQHPRIGKMAAVKVLAAELTQDLTIVRRLLQEARAVNQIHHPNIVDIFSFGELPDGRPYFVMEYLQGESLETALTRESLPRAEIVPLFEQLCLALGAAHKAGFIHRDLKPDNLWVVRTPNQAPALKILDFGIAKTMDDAAPSLTKTGQVMGTPHYMAPEQAMGRPVDERTDIYALGVILYRLAAGVVPFPDQSVNAVIVKHATQDAPRPSSHRRLPAPFDTVIMRCLAKDPSQRPQTTGDLWRELKPALDEWAGVPSAVPNPPAQRPVTGTEATILATDSRTIPPVERIPTGPAVQKNNRRSGLIGVALATLSVLVATGIFFANRHPAEPIPLPTEPVLAPADARPYAAHADTVVVPKAAEVPSEPARLDAGANPSPRVPVSPPSKKPKRTHHEEPRPILL
jgi:serine/threonine protein kinase